MQKREEIIIRRNSIFFKCYVCKKKYPSNFHRCPFCFGNFDIKYHFNGLKMKQIEEKDFKELDKNLRTLYLQINDCIFQTGILINILDKTTHSVVAKEEEKWITPSNFFLQTQICSSGQIAVMFKRDEDFFNICGKREGRKFYIKKEAALKYLKEYAGGKILNNTIKYLKEREKTCTNHTMQKNSTAEQTHLGKPLC